MKLESVMEISGGSGLPSDSVLRLMAWPAVPTAEWKPVNVLAMKVMEVSVSVLE